VALLLAAFGLVPMANLLTNGHALPWFGAAAGEWVLYGGVTVLLAAGAAAFAGDAVDRALAAAWRAVMAPRPAWFAWLAAAFTLALSAAIAQYAFAREPHSVDEMVTLWQAKILASGRFALAPHAHREFVSMMNVIDWGRWYAIFPVGGPALFSLGVRAGAAWLVDPVCAAVGVAAAYHFVRRAYDDPTARATAMLLSLSPFFIFMAAGFQSHVPALAALMVALAALPAWRDAQTPRDAVRASVVAGLALGALVSIRPLDGFLAALVIGAFQISHAVRANGRARWIAIAAQGAAGALPVAFMLFANARTTGHPLLLAYNVMWSGVGLGFGASPFGEAHTPVRALVLLSQMLMRMDVYLFEWPLPGILLAVATLFLVRTPVDWDLLAAGLITAFVCGYALYWHDGFWVGPRFIYPTVPLWVLLTVRAPSLIAARWPGATVRRAAMLLIPLCVIGSLAWPASASGARMRAEQYRASLPQFRTDIGAQARAAHLTNALVFVHEGWGAREMARMWALGVPRRDAEFLYSGSDGCALEMALLWEESPPPADSAGRPARLRAATPEYARAGLAPRPDLTGDGTMRFSDQGPWTSQCRSNAVADSAGVSLYPPFLLQNTIDANGELGGDVIYVRDLGAHNAALMTMYGSRTWYRYIPQRSADDTASVFRPYR
jgi:hypothetical protein